MRKLGIVHKWRRMNILDGGEEVSQEFKEQQKGVWDFVKWLKEG